MPPGSDLTENIPRDRSKKRESRRDVRSAESRRDQVQRSHNQNRDDPDTFYLARFFANMFSETDQYRDHEDYREEQKGYRKDHIPANCGIPDTRILPPGFLWIGVGGGGGGIFAGGISTGGCAGRCLLRKGRVRREERRRRDRGKQQDGEDGGRAERAGSEPSAGETEHRPAAVQNSRRTPMRAVRAVRS